MSKDVLLGNDLLLFVDGVAVGHAKSHTVSISANVIDKSSKDDKTWNTKHSGRLTWNVSTDGLVSYDDTRCNYEALYTKMVAKTQVVLVSALIDAANTTQAFTPLDSIYTGTAIISSVELTSPDDDNATFSVSFEGTGSFIKTPTTTAATAITTTDAILNAKVNPQGISTTVTWEYGITEALGSTAARNPAGAITNSTETAVASVTLTGLTAATKYYFRVKTVAGGFTRYGQILSFTTL